MINKVKNTFLVAVLFSIVLTGCGFQLRGLDTGKLSTQFQKTYLSEDTDKVIHTDNHSPFYQSVKQLIQTNGGALTDKEQSNIIVILSPITTHSRQIALANKGLLKEYERTYKTTVTVIDSSNNSQLGSRVVSTVKDIQLNDNQVLASEEQVEITNKEAYQSLAQSVLLYLQSF